MKLLAGAMGTHFASGAHDDYGKRILQMVAGSSYEAYGPSVEIDYGAGHPARIDGVVNGNIAVEIESRTAKQVRGAVLDLLHHDAPKKLLVLVPTSYMISEVMAEQCRKIIGMHADADDFRVVVLKGDGDSSRKRSDVLTVRKALAELDPSTE